MSRGDPERPILGDEAPAPVRVGIGEYAVVDGEESLVTSGLGSCVGVALYDPAAGVGGLLHAMLPASSEARGGDPGKFVDTGIRKLATAVVDAGAARGRLRAKVAGGGEMFDFDGPSIGARNVDAAEEVCSELDIPVVATDVGGDRGRTLQLAVASGDLHVRTADGTNEVL